MDRSRLREYVFKVVFQLEFIEETEHKDRFEQFLSLHLEDESEKTRTYITEKLQNIVGRLSDIDGMIAANTRGWRIERLNKADLAILRLGVYELLFDEDIPVSVAISEAVVLAKRFSTPKSASFINGILAQIAKDRVAKEQISKEETR